MKKFLDNYLKKEFLDEDVLYILRFKVSDIGVLISVLKDNSSKKDNIYYDFTKEEKSICLNHIELPKRFLKGYVFEKDIGKIRVLRGFDWSKYCKITRDFESFTDAELMFECLSEDKLSLWESFLFFFEDTWSKIKCFIEGLKQIVSWMPTVYRQRDFDYAFLYVLLEIKLQRMIKVFKESDYHDNKNKVKWMNSCVVLINRLLLDEYYLEAKKESEIIYEQILIENKKKEKDRDLLFKIMSKRIDNWWS